MARALSAGAQVFVAAGTWTHRALSSRSLLAVDESIYRRSRALLINESVETWVARYSNLGERPWVWAPPVASGALFDSVRRGKWVRAGWAIALGWASNEVLKRLIHRPRPRLADCPPVAEYPDNRSFPSSHATTSFAAAFALGPLVWRAPLIFIALSQSGVRLALGAHYPSDLVAGAALGWVVARPTASA